MIRHHVKKKNRNSKTASRKGNDDINYNDDRGAGAKLSYHHSNNSRTRRNSQVFHLALVFVLILCLVSIPIIPFFRLRLHEYYFPVILSIQEEKENESSKKAETPTSNVSMADNASREVVLTNEIEKFNSELFCPVNPKPSLKPVNLNLLKLVEDIYQLQHPIDCFGPSQKYWIVDHPCSTGMFATFDCWEYYFTQAFSMNRTFLWTNHGGMTGFTSPELCPSNKSGYECFFLPVSHCNPDEVIAHYNTSKHSYFHYSPKGPKPNISSSDPNSEHVWFVDKRWSWHRATYWDRKAVVDAKRYTNVTTQDYRAIVNSFFLRMQPFLRQKVDTAVKQILLKTAGEKANNNNKTVSSETTISMAIRWGDKCAEWDGRKSGIKYSPIEMQCYNATEYMEIAKTVQQLKPSINAVIATSESKSIINTILSDEEFNQRFTVIINDKDVMQGASLLNNVWADKSTDHDQALETMVSILSVSVSIFMPSTILQYTNRIGLVVSND